MEATKPATVKKLVKYTGRNTTRIISNEDFEREGVKGQRTATWENQNGWTVPASHFSEAALAVVLRQPNLELVEVGDNGTKV